MAEIEISSREELEAWLKDKPREVSVAIASRAALRVFPLLVELVDYHEFGAEILLSVCRYIALPWVVAKYPTHSKDLRTFVIGSAHSTNTNFIYASSAAASVDSVYEIIATDNSYAAEAVYAVAVTAEAAETIDATSVIWGAVSSDMNFLTLGAMDGKEWPLCTSQLTQKKLWLGETDNSMPKWVGRYWRNMSSSLDEREEDSWWVWKKWYEARFNGQSTVRASTQKNEEIDLAIAKLDDADWKKGPAHVNGIIAKLFEEAENIPKVESSIKANQQSSQKLAEHFQTVSLNVDAIIKTNAAERENHIAKKPNDPEKLEQWEELDKYFEETGNKLGKIQTELQKVKNEDDIVDVAENTVPILIDYRDELINQLRSNKKEVVNLIIKTSCFAGSIALLNLVGIPPLAGLIVSAPLLGANEVLKALRDYFLNKDK